MRMKIAILVEGFELHQYLTHLEQVRYLLNVPISTNRQEALDCHNNLTNFIDGLKTALESEFQLVELRKYK